MHTGKFLQTMFSLSHSIIKLTHKINTFALNYLSPRHAFSLCNYTAVYPHCHWNTVCFLEFLFGNRILKTKYTIKWTFFSHNFYVFRVLSSSLIFERGNIAQKKQEAPGKQIYLGQTKLSSCHLHVQYILLYKFSDTTSVNTYFYCFSYFFKYML